MNHVFLGSLSSLEFTDWAQMKHIDFEIRIFIREVDGNDSCRLSWPLWLAQKAFRRGEREACWLKTTGEAAGSARHIFRTRTWSGSFVEL